MNATIGCIRGTNRWQSLRQAKVVAVCFWLTCAGIASATDFYWTNNTTGGNFTNAANWFTNGFLSTTVPGTADNPSFTNNSTYTVNWTSDVTNSNTLFNAQSGTVTLNVSAQTWSLLDQFIVGQTAATASVVHTSGMIVISNAAGNGTLTIGQPGKGTFTLGGGTVIADQLLATNNLSGSYTNSVVVLNSGTLNALHGSRISALGDLNLGAGGGTLNWNILGGTNVTAATGNINLGTSAGSRALILVSGAGTLWSNSATLFNLGPVASANQNELVISNQAHVISGNTTIGGNSVGAVATLSNRVTVTGSNTIWDTGSIMFGYRGSKQDGLIITNGGLVRAASVTSGGAGSGSVEEKIIVTDPGSRLLISGFLSWGQLGTNNSLTIANGGVVSNGTTAWIGNGVAGRDNSVVVTDAGSRWISAGTLNVGYQGTRNSLVISNGGSVTALADAWIGSVNSASNASVLVTGPGSRWDVGTILYVGVSSSGNTMVISNRAEVTAQTLYVGNSTGTNLLQIADAGLLEANTLIAGNFVSNRIQNTGGIYQFSTNTPVITPNTAGAISLNNGTISFRGITNANVFGNWTGSQLTNIDFQGNNAFRLNNASNATGVASYTFNTGLGATNYSRLILQNDGRWRSTTLNIGTGGSLIGNGTVESTSVTNLGTIAPGFSAGLLTFTSNLVLGASSRLEMEIGGTNAVDYDRLIVSGSVTVTGMLAVASINGFNTTPGETFTLIDNLGVNPIFGQFDGLTNNAFLDASANGGSAYFRIQYNGGTGNDLVLLATIPEPSVLAFLTMAAYALLRRRAARA